MLSLSFFRQHIQFLRPGTELASCNFTIISLFGAAFHSHTHSITDLGLHKILQTPVTTTFGSK